MSSEPKLQKDRPVYHCDLYARFLIRVLSPENPDPDLKFRIIILSEYLERV